MNTQTAPRSTDRRLASDAGFSLAELLVVMAVIGILFAIGASALHAYTGISRSGVDRAELWSTMQDANGQLLRDVQDGQKIESATAQSLVLYVVRDELCVRRSYTADATARTMAVTTDWFAQQRCAGPTESKTEVLVADYVGALTFTYGNAMSKQIPAPVEDVRNITRVAWTLTSHPTGAANDVQLSSGAVFRGHSDATGSGKDSVTAQSPILSVSTNVNPTTKEGLSPPVLTWTDTTPSVTVGWTVYRVSNPEGATTGAKTWTPISTFTVAQPAPASNTFTDASLQPGFNGVYVVQANIADPNGQAAPMSNQVVTGLRPAAIANLAAVAAAQTITLTWTAPAGQVGADIYRDGVLFDRVAGGTATYTDGPGKTGWTQNPSEPTLSGFGHSHTYQVAPSNRWELVAMTGSQTTFVTMGDPLTKVYNAPVTGNTTRSGGNAAGAFTAPARPTVSSGSNTDWTYTLNWAAAPWVGSGPTVLGGVARDRGWLGFRNASVTAAPTGTWDALWSGVENGPSVATRKTPAYGATEGGNYGHFQAQTCNAVGCSPAATTNDSIMRPKAPLNCTAAAPSTRATTVTINPDTAQAPNTGSTLTGGTAAAGFTVAGTGTSGGFAYNVDQLAHATAHTFTATVTNTGGASDPVTCGVTTLTLGVSAPTWNSTTLTINASATATNATDSNITLEGVATVAGLTGSWDPLADGTAFTVTARAGDGVNGVAAQTAASTKVLAKPAAPTCSAFVSDGVAPGAISISGGTQVKLGSGGAAYGSPRAYSGLGAGSYVGYARTSASDGFNSAWSGWDACPTKTVTDPYPSAWGSSAPGCPKPALYIPATAPSNWQIRRSSATGCQLKWFLTSYGANGFSTFVGDVIDTGSYVIDSGAMGYTRTGGGASAMGPLAW
ncbi:MAG: prepilin-type N-terminal cleavage/methylation domain-containing protein [Cellulomonas sp.]